ncbi:hypothetical protein KJ865_08550, partial [Myxococcota bacterium]|nr:hypothetical protein [Myxococcota bacterium]
SYHCSSDPMPPGFRECTREELSYSGSSQFSPAINCRDPKCFTFGPPEDPICAFCYPGGSLCGEDGNIYTCNTNGEQSLILEICDPTEGMVCVEINRIAKCQPAEK